MHEIMKYAIYAKSAQLNSVFCLDFEFFHHFPFLELSKGRQLLYGIMVAFDQCVMIKTENYSSKNYAKHKKTVLIMNGL